jgi:hypothetical protein
VLASLLVSVLLVGMKLTAAKEIVQIIERRKELKANLLLLRIRLEEESLVEWLDDVMHDTKQRSDRILAMKSAPGLIDSTSESVMIQENLSMFALFEGSEGSSAGVSKLKHSATIDRMETKHEPSGCLLGRAEAVYRAAPHDIVAYMLNYDGRHICKSTWNPDVDVRDETVQHVNSHHTIMFARKKGLGIQDRTFLNSIVAQQIAEDPPTFVLIGAPIATHDKITRKDEAKAVRAENRRSFKITEVAPGRSRVEYVCSISLFGFIPQLITNMVVVPGQVREPISA